MPSRSCVRAPSPPSLPARSPPRPAESPPQEQRRMSNITLRSPTRLLAAALAAAALAGCASLDKAPELVVRERATQRWSALVAEDFEKAYTYMPPSYRAATPFERYKNSFKGAIKWVGAEVVW